MKKASPAAGRAHTAKLAFLELFTGFAVVSALVFPGFPIAQIPGKFHGASALQLISQWTAPVFGFETLTPGETVFPVF